MFDEKKEFKKLKTIVAKLPEEKRELAEGIISNCAFMIVELDKLRKSIQENGVVMEYKNGKEQYGYKESVSFSAYIKMQKVYTSNISLLNRMLPKDMDSEPNELERWIAEYD
ncbi:MAG: hypothetical protein K5879_00505 [Lachnospiraceae bacterium]|nr:hypothetical protein [Lachnospiraceae bacterium]